MVQCDETCIWGWFVVFTKQFWLEGVFHWLFNVFFCYENQCLFCCPLRLEKITTWSIQEANRVWKSQFRPLSHRTFGICRDNFGYMAFGFGNLTWGNSTWKLLVLQMYLREDGQMLLAGEHDCEHGCLSLNNESQQLVCTVLVLFRLYQYGCSKLSPSWLQPPGRGELYWGRHQ